MKAYKVNEEVPENACIIVLNWKGKGYKMGAKLPNVEQFEEDNIKLFQKSISTLSRWANKTIDFVEVK